MKNAPPARCLFVAALAGLVALAGFAPAASAQDGRSRTRGDGNRSVERGRSVDRGDRYSRPTERSRGRDLSPGAERRLRGDLDRSRARRGTIDRGRVGDSYERRRNLSPGAERRLRGNDFDGGRRLRAGVVVPAYRYRRPLGYYGGRGYYGGYPAYGYRYGDAGGAYYGTTLGVHAGRRYYGYLNDGVYADPYGYGSPYLARGPSYGASFRAGAGYRPRHLGVRYRRPFVYGTVGPGYRYHRPGGRFGFSFRYDF